MAYELRRRGYDVEARKAPNVPDDRDAVLVNWDRLFVNQRFTPVGDFDATIALSNLEREIGTYGDGSRSVVFVSWQSGGSHVFIAERQNGQVVFVDPQTGEIDYTSWQAGCWPFSIQVSRIDDKQVDQSFLGLTVKEA